MRNIDSINKAIEKIEKNLKDSPKESLKLALKVSGQISSIEDEAERAELYYSLGVSYHQLSEFLTYISHFLQKLIFSDFQQLA